MQMVLKAVAHDRWVLAHILSVAGIVQQFHCVRKSTRKA